MGHFYLTHLRLYYSLIQQSQIILVTVLLESRVLDGITKMEILWYGMFLKYYNMYHDIVII